MGGWGSLWIAVLLSVPYMAFRWARDKFRKLIGRKAK